MQDLSVEEYDARLARVREKIDRSGADLWLVTRPENIYYLTGYRAAHVAARTSRLHTVVVPRDGDPILVARSLESVTAEEQRAPQVLLFDDDVDPYPLLREALDVSDRSVVVGVEERFLSVRQFNELRRVLRIANTIDITGSIEQLASAPSEQEQRSLRASAAITQCGISAAAQALRPGRKAHDVVGAAHAAMYAAGQSDFDKALVAVWTGPAGGAMHDTRTTMVIREGDVATVEIMGVDHHQRTGAQACFHIGDSPADDLVRAHQLVLDMHDAAIAEIHAGQVAGAVFDAADRVYKSARGVPYHRRVGGSMGLTNFAVDLTRGSSAVLSEGQPILVQTLVAEPALVTHATTVMVTRDGCTGLTTSPRDFRPPTDGLVP